MNDMLKREGAAYAAETAKNADIKITLEQWPCAIAVLGICATYAFVSWVNRPVEEPEHCIHPLLQMHQR